MFRSSMNELIKGFRVNVRTLFHVIATSGPVIQILKLFLKFGRQHPMNGVSHNKIKWIEGGENKKRKKITERKNKTAFFKKNAARTLQSP